MRKLTPYQRVILINLAEGRQRFHGIYGLSEKGAAGRVYWAMADRGWIAVGQGLTEAGRKVLADGRYER